VTANDMHHRHSEYDTQLASPPSWALWLSALMLASGIIWRSCSSAARRGYPLDRTLVVDALPRNDRPGCATRTLHASHRREWKAIVSGVYNGITEDRILLIAAGVTFYLILALFPGIAALVSIYGLFVDPRTMVNHLDLVGSVAPGGAIDVLREELTRLGQQNGTALGISFLLSLAISSWTATSATKAIFDGLNVAYGEVEKRSYIKLSAIALIFTVGAIVFVLLSIAAVVALPIVLNYIPLPGLTDIVLRIARWPILFVMIAFALTVFYRYGPCRPVPRGRWITWGSLLATVVWLAASILFSWYVAHFGSYNRTYGSLGAIIGFMTWIWLSIIVVLLGAELNAEIEDQTTQHR
jgi:membrane protein